MKKLVLVSLLLAPLAMASSVNPTKITKVLVGPDYGTKAFITVSTKPSAVPACQTGNIYDFVFDGATDTGKLTLGVMLAAYTAKQDVWIGGKDSCQLYGGVEDLAHIVAL